MGKERGEGEHQFCWEAEECEKGNFETHTMLGRRRVVEPDRGDKPKFTERLNAPVQGTAADILKLAMAHLWEGLGEHPDALPILTVHDEVVIECDTEAEPHGLAPDPPPAASNRFPDVRAVLFVARVSTAHRGDVHNMW